LLLFTGTVELNTGAPPQSELLNNWNVIVPVGAFKPLSVAVSLIELPTVVDVGEAWVVKPAVAAFGMSAVHTLRPWVAAKSFLPSGEMVRLQISTIGRLIPETSQSTAPLGNRRTPKSLAA
jgi:hypothetical protein